MGDEREKQLEKAVWSSLEMIKDLQQRLDANSKTLITSSEKLKKAVEIIKNHKQFCGSPYYTQAVKEFLEANPLNTKEEIK